MPDDREAPNAYEMIVAFGYRNGEEGQVKWVETADGRRVYDPGPRLADDPMVCVDLIDVEVCNVVVYRNQGDPTIRYCTNVRCRRYCC